MAGIVGGERRLASALAVEPAGRLGVGVGHVG